MPSWNHFIMEPSTAILPWTQRMPTSITSPVPHHHTAMQLALHGGVLGLHSPNTLPTLNLLSSAKPFILYCTTIFHWMQQLPSAIAPPFPPPSQWHAMPIVWRCAWTSFAEYILDNLKLLNSATPHRYSLPHPPHYHAILIAWWCV